MSEEVTEAKGNGQPVLALDSSYLCAGPTPHSRIEALLQLEEHTRQEGTIPAILGILDGRLKIGMSRNELEQLAAKSKLCPPVQRRDLPILLASGGSGVTAISAGMIMSHLAGIRVFSTGHLPHPQSQNHSNPGDWFELTRTEVAIVSTAQDEAPPPRTQFLELENRGVPVVTFRMSETQSAQISSCQSCRVDSAETLARMMHSQWALGLGGGILIVQAEQNKSSRNMISHDALATLHQAWESNVHLGTRIEAAYTALAG